MESYIKSKTSEEIKKGKRGRKPEWQVGKFVRQKQVYL